MSRIRRCFFSCSKFGPLPKASPLREKLSKPRLFGTEVLTDVGDPPSLWDGEPMPSAAGTPGTAFPTVVSDFDIVPRPTDKKPPRSGFASGLIPSDHLTDIIQIGIHGAAENGQDQLKNLLHDVISPFGSMAACFVLACQPTSRDRWGYLIRRILQENGPSVTNS